MTTLKQKNKPGAPPGNEFYKLVKMPGRKKKYTPANLWKKAMEYFEWVNKNPLKEEKVFGTGKRMKVPKLRPMSETAFCLYAGIDENTFQRYKSHENYKDFWAVSETISKIIYTQKFEGAVADLMNPNIIARDLGLKDQQGIDIGLNNMSDSEVDKIYNKLESIVKNEIGKRKA